VELDHVEMSIGQGKTKGEVPVVSIVGPVAQIDVDNDTRLDRRCPSTVGPSAGGIIHMKLIDGYLLEGSDPRRHRLGRQIEDVEFGTGRYQETESSSISDILGVGNPATLTVGKQDKVESLTATKRVTAVVQDGHDGILVLIPHGSLPRLDFGTNEKLKS
jgi:hypothetical protein